MNDIIAVALLAGCIAALPSFLLLCYRRTIPIQMMWVGILCSWTMPFIGWFIALYIALKDWGIPEDKD